MSQEEMPKIVVIDVDPNDVPELRAPVVFSSGDVFGDFDGIKDSEREFTESRVKRARNERVRNSESENYRPRRLREEKPKVSLLKKAKRIGAATLIAAGGAGVYVLYNGIFSGGGHKMEAKAKVEETRVYPSYHNVPLQLARIESDIDLEMKAGYDRTVSIGPFEADLIPFNNEYTLKQNDLTTETTATLTVSEMVIKETPKEIIVTLKGGMDISKASIDWRTQEFAGADINSTDLSFGNDKKDQIDNDALEILQSSGEVAAACALRSEEVQPALTVGVKKFLEIVKPELVKKNKELVVYIENIDIEADRIYAEAVDTINAVVRDIGKDYSGKNDIFDVDISGIVDCDSQNIRIEKEDKSNKKLRLSYN